MKGLKIVGTFLIGAASGAAAMWFGVKEYYKKRADQEVAEARKAFHSLMRRRRANKDISEEEKKDEPSEKPEETAAKKETVLTRDVKSYIDILEENEYRTGMTQDYDESKQPYEIDMIEFDKTKYQKIYLMWFSQDKCLCNANSGQVYLEIEDLIGNEGKERIIESYETDEEDKFYVRNDRFQIDFCVQLEHYDTYYGIFGDGSEE